MSNGRGRWMLAIGILALLAQGCLGPMRSGSWEAQIYRTDGGIPHIVAEDLPSLAFGTLYAQAEDNVCILAEQYLTFGAERARFLGPAEGRLESDLFYQFLIDRGDAAEPLPADLEALFEGAARGYNHFLETRGDAGLGDPRCTDAAWIRRARVIDLKRVSRIDYALAYMRPILLAAAPPARGEVPARSESTAESKPDRRSAYAFEIARRVEEYLEVPKQGGSNGIAIGRDAALGGPLLLANPHMPWNEPFQRFYPMHQTIPGVSNVMGANLIGRPRVGFGHTEHVAWTSTVSKARRLSFYRLELDPEDPTAYRFDGETIPMKRRVVRVSVLNSAGEIEEASHTFYETHFGALLVESPIFGWTQEQAFAVRLLDAAWRGETSIRDQYAARSVRELKAVHDRDQFLPVNLIAADRQGEVLYADPGPIPNLPDELMADCVVLGGAALDGSRSACQWRSSEDAAAPGIFPPQKLPARYRSDFVTNSNDSFWLANPAEPLDGFARSLGEARTPRTLRTRSGLSMVAREIQAEGGLSLEALRDLTLANENQAGRLIRDDVVRFCREAQSVRLAESQTVDLTEACRVLEDWDLHANLESRGALLFRQMLVAAQGGKFSRRLPEAFTPAVPFDVDDPVHTPRGLAASAGPAVLEALAQAIVALEAVGIPLDAPLGDHQGVTRNGERIPLHGGPEIEGIFNKIESEFRGAGGYTDVDSWSSSWILAVEFADDGPRSFGILTYSLSANPESAHFTDQTRGFSRKEWVALPFRLEEVEAAAERSYRVQAAR